MSGGLDTGSLMCKKRIFITILKFIFSLKRGGLIAFGYFGYFAHVKFKTGQFIVESLSKGELAFRVLERMRLFEVFNIKYALGNVSGAFFEERLNGCVLDNGRLVTGRKVEGVELFVEGFLFVVLEWASESDGLGVGSAVAFFH
jgi:hypothetical protein